VKSSDVLSLIAVAGNDASTDAIYASWRHTASRVLCLS